MLYDNEMTIVDLEKHTLDYKINIGQVLHVFGTPLTMLNDLSFQEATGKDDDVGAFDDGWEYNRDSKPSDLDHGVEPTKFGASSRVDKIGMREAQFRFKKKHADFGGMQFLQLADDQIEKKAKALALDCEHDLLYADYRKDPRLFMGIMPRFSVLTDEDGVIKSGDHAGEISPYITLDAGGTPSGNLSSVIMMVPGRNEVCLIYPKGDLAWGFDYDEGTMTDIPDENNNTVRGRTDIFTSRFGLAIRNRRACIRIANIDVSSDANIVKFIDSLYEAADAIPKELMNRVIIYTPRKVTRALKKYFNAEKHATTYEGAKPQNITGDFEIPDFGYFRRCDHLTNSETKVS